MDERRFYSPKRGQNVNMLRFLAISDIHGDIKAVHGFVKAVKLGAHMQWVRLESEPTEIMVSL